VLGEHGDVVVDDDVLPALPAGAVEPQNVLAAGLELLRHEEVLHGLRELGQA
jgi:hypothetical protein